MEGGHLFLLKSTMIFQGSWFALLAFTDHWRSNSCFRILNRNEIFSRAAESYGAPHAHHCGWTARSVAWSAASNGEVAFARGS